MSAYSRTRRHRVTSVRLAALALFCGIGSLALAQQPIAPKVELFGGYSYVYPNATISGTLPGGIVPVDSCMCGITRGVGAAITYDFNRWLGLTADWSGHWSPTSTTPSLEIGRANLFTYSAGPKFTYRTHHFDPFVEALFGAHHLAPELFTPDTKFGILAGGGLDWLPTRHFGIRLFQADYLMSNHHFGTLASDPNTDLRGVRLQAGVVFNFGGHGPAIVAPAVIPAPVPLAAVEVPAPLTLTCVANPSEMLAGSSSTITATATSTRPVTYSYSTSAGTVEGAGATATLATAGVPAGTVNVVCNAVNDLGQTASQTVPVILDAPVVASVLPTTPLCVVAFNRDARRPSRVDNEAKACLDDVALNLQRTSDSRLILVGYASTSRRDSNRIAAERAVNTKAYLVTDKGLDPARIVVYTAPGDRNDVTILLAPSGSAPDLTNDAPIDESTVTVKPR